MFLFLFFSWFSNIAMVSGVELWESWILTYIQSETPSVWQFEERATNESHPDTLEIRAVVCLPFIHYPNPTSFERCPEVRSSLQQITVNVCLASPTPTFPLKEQPQKSWALWHTLANEGSKVVLLVLVSLETNSIPLANSTWDEKLKSNKLSLL